jgi:hypothetical protein
MFETHVYLSIYFAGYLIEMDACEKGVINQSIQNINGQAITGEKG